MYSFIIRNKMCIMIGSLIIMLYGIIGLIKGFIYSKGFKKLNILS